MLEYQVLHQLSKPFVLCLGDIKVKWISGELRLLIKVDTIVCQAW